MAIDPLETAQPLRSPESYRRGAAVIHWLMFVLVAVVGTLGLLLQDWPKPTQVFWINVHALVGLTLWLTLLVRFAYRRRHAPPVLPDIVGAFARRFSSPVHWALYGLMFIIPLFGVVTFVYHGRVFDFGLFQLDLGIKKNKAIFGPTEDIHGYLAYALFGLAGLHAAAALWHQFYLRDGVLRRMWPFGTLQTSPPVSIPSAKGEERRV